MSTMSVDANAVRSNSEVRWSLLKQGVVAWQRRLRMRRELTTLNARDLRDLGISRCDAEFEAHKPFWTD
jgi:uncharacterized protein YjiS (DUF1127 family)